MNCPGCSNIMFIDHYHRYDDRHTIQLTCSVCRVIVSMVRPLHVVGFQFQD